MRVVVLVVVALVVAIAGAELALRPFVVHCPDCFGELWGVELPPYRIIAPGRPASTAAQSRAEGSARAQIRSPEPSAASEPTGRDLRGVLEFHALIGHVPSRNVQSPQGWSPQNNLGARSRSDLSRAIPSGARRALIFGDSFARGSRVRLEESWPHLLDGDRDGWEVVNFGVDAYGLGQTLLYYRSVRDELEHDLVVLVWVPFADLWRDVNTMRSLGEDWKSYTLQPRFVLDHGTLRLVESPYREPEAIYEENREGPSARLIAHLEKYDTFYFSSVHGLPPPVLGRSILFKLLARALHVRFKRKLDRDLKLGPFDLDSEALRVSAALVAQMAGEVRGAGVEFLLVVLPEHVTLENVVHIPGRRENWQQLVSIVCDAAGGDCLDLLPAFLEQPEFLWDRGADGTHFGPSANRIIAESLGEVFPARANGASRDERVLVGRPGAGNHRKSRDAGPMVGLPAALSPTERKGRMRTRSIVAAGVFLGLAAEAGAVTLAAGPLGIGVRMESALECAIVNVGGSPVSVTVTARFREQEPTVRGPLTLLPGEASSLREPNEQRLSREGYCLFDVLGRASNVRATASVVDPEGNRGASVEAY